MPLNPGNLTITFDPPGRFTEDRLHTIPASEGLSSFEQAGCTIQSATTKDKVSDTAYAETDGKCIAPYNDNTASVTSEWYATNNLTGSVYRVLGYHHTYDSWARVDHVTLMLKKEEG